jgi:cob(I)alamin adenosyltransferase
LRLKLGLLLRFFGLVIICCPLCRRWTGLGCSLRRRSGFDRTYITCCHNKTSNYKEKDIISLFVLIGSLFKNFNFILIDQNGESRMQRGYIQVYTGNGKGKTTAAIGLAIRAAGAGLRVFFCQFLKAQNYSEITSLKRFEDVITVKQFGNENFIVKVPTDSDIAQAIEGFEEALHAIMSGMYDLVILDEINYAISLKLIKLQSVVQLIKNKPVSVEIILTGRNAATEIIEIADLVSEIKEIKHYYNNGVLARKGIEM